MNKRNRLVLLTAAHVVVAFWHLLAILAAGGTTSALAPLYLLAVMMPAVMMPAVIASGTPDSSFILLAFWAVAPPQGPLVRILGWTVGGVLLSAPVLLLIASGQNGSGPWDTGHRASYPLAFVALTCAFFLVRVRWFELVRVSDSFVEPGPGRVRFSLGTVLASTFLFALILGLARGVTMLRGQGGAILDFLGLAAVSGTVLFLSGLSAIWAVLSFGPPWKRSLVAVAVIAALQGLVLFGSGPFQLRDLAKEYPLILLVVIGRGWAVAVVTIGSLLVVRSCGYRVIWKISPDVPPIQHDGFSPG